MALNLSVWQDIASLKAFVYQHAHHAAMKDRDLWFEKLSKPSYALWWVPHDVTPTLKDANPRVDC